MFIKLYPPDGHPTIENIRSRITTKQQHLIDSLWAEYISNRVWPTRWDCVQKHGPKDRLFSLGQELSGNVVFEMPGHDRNTIQLTFLGMLVTTKAPIVEIALVGLVQHIMRGLEQGDLDADIECAQFFPNATNEKTVLDLWCAFDAFDIIPHSSRVGPPECSLRLSEEIDGLTDYENAEEYLIAIAFDRYKEGKPFSIRERQVAGLEILHLTKHDFGILLDCCSVAKGHEKRVELIVAILANLLVGSISVVLGFFVASLFFPQLDENVSQLGGFRIAANILGFLGVVWGITLKWLWRSTTKFLKRVFRYVLNIGIRHLSKVARQKEVHSWAQERHFE